MNVEIITITKPELQAIIERTAVAVAEELRETLASARTPELMTRAELAEYLRCDVSKINRYMKDGLPVEYFGSTPRYRKADIDRWLKNEHFQEIPGTPA